MSLEQTLNETNDLLKQIVTILQTGINAPAELQAEPETTKRTRRTKAEMEAAGAGKTVVEKQQPAVTVASDAALGLVDGDPVGTRYFHIAKHNTLYVQKPGDPDCTIQGCEIIPAAEYLRLKEVYAKKTQEALGAAATPVTESAETPAQTTQDASTASSTTSEDVPFSKIVERITAVSKSAEPGHGREGVLAILKKWLPGDEKPTVTKLQPLGKNAAILADIEAVLTPAAAEEEFDPLA